MSVNKRLTYDVHDIPEHVTESLNTLIENLLAHARKLWESQDLGDNESVEDVTDPKPKPKTPNVWWDGPDDVTS